MDKRAPSSQRADPGSGLLPCEMQGGQAWVGGTQLPRHPAFLALPGILTKGARRDRPRHQKTVSARGNRLPELDSPPDQILCLLSCPFLKTSLLLLLFAQMTVNLPRRALDRALVLKPHLRGTAQGCALLPTWGYNLHSSQPAMRGTPTVSQR